jgi:hypothetical protein
LTCYRPRFHGAAWRTFTILCIHIYIYIYIYIYIWALMLSTCVLTSLGTIFTQLELTMAQSQLESSAFWIEKHANRMSGRSDWSDYAVVWRMHAHTNSQSARRLHRPPRLPSPHICGSGSWAHGGHIIA